MATARVQIGISFKADNLAMPEHLAAIRRAVNGLQLPEFSCTIVEQTIETHQFDNLSL